MQTVYFVCSWPFGKNDLNHADRSGPFASRGNAEKFATGLAQAGRTRRVEITSEQVTDDSDETLDERDGEVQS